MTSEATHAVNQGVKYCHKAEPAQQATNKINAPSKWSSLYGIRLPHLVVNKRIELMFSLSSGGLTQPWPNRRPGETNYPYESKTYQA
jgi:hypothetical protein